MSEHFSSKLDNALLRLQRGEAMESILADYPSQRDELAPLLFTMQELSQLSQVPPPSDPDAGLAIFLEEARALRPESNSQRTLSRWWADRLATFRELWWRPPVRLAVGSFLSIFLLVVVLGILMTLAGESLPGDALYAIKLAREEMHLVATLSPAERAEYHLAQASTRAQEIQRLTQANRPVPLKTLERMNQALEDSLTMAATANRDEMPRLLARIEETSFQQAELLAQTNTTSSNARTRQLLSQARTSLAQARSFARAGRADVGAFALNARLGMFQIGNPQPAPTASVTPTTAGTPTVTATSTATVSVTANATATRKLIPSLTPTASYTAKPPATFTPLATDTSMPIHTPEPAVWTNTPKPLAPTNTPVLVPPTSTPEPPPPTKVPPGLTNTPEPPGQTKEPPGQAKPTKPPKQ